MEKLTDLPPLAIIVFGATLAVIFGIRYLGLWQGEHASPATNPASAQVAAVIVDPAALNAATAAVARHTEAVKDMTEVAETATRHLGHVATELDRIREEMLIQRELSRRG